MVTIIDTLMQNSNYVLIGICAVVGIFIYIFIISRKKDKSMLVNKMKILSEELVRANSMNKQLFKFLKLKNKRKYLVCKLMMINVKFKNKIKRVYCLNIRLCLFDFIFVNPFDNDKFFIVSDDFINFNGKFDYILADDFTFYKRANIVLNLNDYCAKAMFNYFSDLFDKENIDSGVYAQIFKTTYVDLDDKKEVKKYEERKEEHAKEIQ